MNWTEDQKKVIETSGRNILVSAAAGSGKTAVLVERILEKISDPEKPVGIDEMLIVTFTKAAAGEMRERLLKRITEALAKDPENEHLKEQTALIHSAQITTIDGFCSYVIREYGYRIDLVPGFRTADESVSALMRNDVMSRVMEDAHADPDPVWHSAFKACVETFASGRSEKTLEEAVMAFVNTAEAGPDPDAFLTMCERNLEVQTVREMEESAWMRAYMADADARIAQGLLLTEMNLALCMEPDGPSQYLENARLEHEFYKELSKAESYEERRALLLGYSLKRLSTKKNKDADPEKAELFKARRAEYEEIRKKKLTPSFQMTPEHAFEVQQKSAGPVLTLIALARRFREEYAAEKERKSLLDFSDLEHLALRILRNSDGERTEAARELAAFYEEVFIDEYQDSNFLQEAILMAVSRNEDGEQNYFCVGDVKQSIYSFRQARPELFTEKADLYGKDGQAGIRIDLHENFRSRHEVIDSVNGIFRQLMRKEIGGVSYDDAAALYAGADYPEGEGFRGEFLCVLTDTDELPEEDEEDPEGLEGIGTATASELEARAIGMRIRELTKNQDIYDRKSGTFRKPGYGDIVILLRSMGERAETFVRVLEDLRIPVVSTAKSAYFTAPEVVQVLSLLQILDNPLQDIPFSAVLAGPLAGCSFEDLAYIRASSDGGRLYRDARKFAADDTEHPELRAKLDAFFEMYDGFRMRMADLPLSELVYTVIHETGYMDYVKALPGGSQRTVNLETLIDKAMEFEQSGMSGLFNFIRYIENLKKANQDFGERSVSEGEADVVRITTIHKSKGLEYPIVFVAGMSKRFNLTDVRKTLLVHPQLGAASLYIDYEKRLKMPTLMRSSIENRMLRDQIGEELRVLYVALTRAEQKLIICGTAADEDALASLCPDLPQSEEEMPENFILSASGPFSLIVPAVMRLNTKAEREGSEPLFDIRLIKTGDLLYEEVRTGIRKEEQLIKLLSLKADTVVDPDVRRQIEERFSYVYPYEGLSVLPIEVSVSELKKAAYTEEAEEEHEVYRLFPEGELTGAERGTVYHRFMELLNYGSQPETEDERELLMFVENEIRRMREKGHFTDEEADVLKREDMTSFLKSDIGRRMRKAFLNGTLKREQPFVLGMDASEIREEWPKGETVYVQGIIDACFREGEGIVLLDYKTDRVSDAATLVSRYRIQLDLYARALERISGISVTQKLIWSFAFHKEIEV